MIQRKKCVYFLGGGNMAAAIIGGLDREHWRVVVCEVVPARRKELEETLRVETVTHVADRKISVRFRIGLWFPLFPIHDTNKE
jgi:pyrroline-5-carboxylate reductase